MRSLPSGSLLRVFSRERATSIYAIESTELLQTIMNRLQAMPPSMLHLGYASMGALLFQALSDPQEPEHVEMQWAVDGPFGKLIADSLGTGKIRSSISYPKVEVSNLHEPLGAGVFQVRRYTPEQNQERYTGLIQSQGDVRVDLAHYLRQSEQRRVLLDMFIDISWDESNPKTPFRINKAYAYLIDVMPGDGADQTLGQWQDYCESLGLLSTWDIQAPNPKMAAQHILEFLAPGESKTLQYSLETELELFCPCSEERAMRALALLSANEKKYLHQDSEGKSEKLLMTCEFCGTTYHIADAG